jgi:antitoxin ParD1/3/4
MSCKPETHGLRALQERDSALKHWLRSEVVPVYDAMKTNPMRGIPAEKIFAELRAQHAARLKARQKRRIILSHPKLRQ